VILSVAIAVMQLPFVPAGAVTVDPDVVAVTAGVNQFAELSRHLGEVGELGNRLAGLDVAPGSSRALDFDTLLPKLLTTRLAAANPSTFADLANIATGAGGTDLETNGRHAVITATATKGATAADPERLTVGIDVTRTVDSGLAIVGASPKVELRSTKGVAVVVHLTSSFTFAYRPSNDTFWVERTATTPAMTVDMTSSVPDPQAIDASLGILAMHASPSSSFNLVEHLVANFSDPDNNGVLAFSETDPATNTRVPGELATAASIADRVTVGFAPSSTSPSTLQGRIGLEPARTTTPGLAFPYFLAGVDINSANLASEPPTVTPSGFNETLTKFQTLTPKDLATGVARVAAAIQAISYERLPTAGTGNIDLPFVRGSVADAIHAPAPLLQFLHDHVDAAGNPDFVSIQGFLDALDGTKADGGTLTIDPASVIYNDDTSRFAFRLIGTGDGSQKTLADDNARGTGDVDAGDAFAYAGLRDVAATSGPSAAKVTRSYNLDLRMVLDLRPPVTGSACSSDPSNPKPGSACPFTLDDVSPTGQVLSTSTITSLPLTADRFLLATGGPVLQASPVITGPVDKVAGRAGFVDVALDGGSFTIDTADGASSMVDIGLKPQGFLSLSKIPVLLRTSPDTLLSYATHARGAFRATASVPGQPDFFDGVSAAVGISVPDSADPSQTTAVDALGGRLLPFGLGGGDPNALRGKVTGAVNALSTTLAEIEARSGPAAHHDLATPLQVIGQPFASFANVPELRAAVDDLSASPPDSLQGLIGVLERPDRLGPNSVSFHVDTSTNPARLVLDVDASHPLAGDADPTVGLTFPSGGTTRTVVGTGSKGTIPVTGTSRAQFSLVLPLDDSSPFDAASVLVSPSSSLDVKPRVSVTGAAITATMGALPLSLGNPDAGAPSSERSRIEARPTLRLAGPAGSAPISLQQWAQDATASVGHDAVTCPTGETTFAICAVLPAYGANGGAFTSPNEFVVRHTSANAFIDGDASNTQAPADTETALDLVQVNLADSAKGIDPWFSSIRHALDAASLGGKMPLVGDDFMQGSKSLDELQTALESALKTSPDTATSSDNSDTIDTQITNALTTALSGSATFKALGVPDVGLLCGNPAHACTPGSPATDITGVTFDLNVGDGDLTSTGCGTGCTDRPGGPLSLGLPGLQLSAASAPTVDLAWKLHLRFGFDKAHGFFVDTDNASNAGKPELQVGLKVNVSDFDGTLAFLKVHVHDLQADPEFSGILGIDLDVPGDHLLTLDTLSHGDLTSIVKPVLSAAVNVRWDVQATAGSNLPGIGGTLVLNWKWDNGAAPGDTSKLTAGFEDVVLDLDPFFNATLGSTYKKIQKAMEPLKPVIDAINAPLPGISDVARLGGGGDVSLLTMLKAYGTYGNTTFEPLERTLHMLDLGYKLGATGKLALGSFGINTDRALAGVPTPDQVGELIKDSPIVSDVQQAIKDQCGVCGEVLGDLQSFAMGDDQAGFHFPAFEHPKSLFGLLLGQDVEIVNFDTGDYVRRFVFEASFGPIPIPLPATIDIGAQGTVHLRFAAGFDTLGLRKALAGGGVASILDGLYLTDFGANGERPEIAITDGVAYVDARVRAGPAEAGIRGAFHLDPSLDLHDDDHDGKVRMAELGKNAATGSFDPLCLFDTAGEISAAVELFLSIDLPIVGHKEFDHKLTDTTLLSLKHDCSRPATPPVLAHVAGSDLIVHVGNNRNLLGAGWYKAGEHPDEEVAVRALHAETPADPSKGPGGAFRGMSVDLLGFHQEFLDPNISRVVISATGYQGAETVSLLGDGGGINPANKVITHRFDRTAVVRGGDENDNITADSSAPVYADGGKGQDLITTGDGADVVTGGADGDNLSTRGGVDHVYGDTPLGSDPSIAPSPADNATDGADHIDAGSGGDFVYGDGGADFVNGGAATATEGDDGNLLVGGSNADNIVGGTGRDTIYGDEVATLGADDAGLTNGGNDTIDTGTGNDEVHAGNGNDTVVGRSAAGTADTIYGNGGSDEVFGGGGNDHLSGGPNDDELLGKGGNDEVRGNDGDDVLEGDGDNVVGNGRGLLSLYASSTLLGLLHDAEAPTDGNDTIYGGAGNDRAFGGGGTDLIYGDDGTAACAAPATNVARSTPPTEPTSSHNGADKLTGGSGNDAISGEGGNDIIAGDAGDDVLCGHAGADDISGNDGADRVFGGTGIDVLYGDDGADQVFGNDDADKASGGPGNDVVEGNGADDAVYGDAGDDHLEGNAGRDSVFGQAGQDDILGGTSPAAVAGGSTASSADTGDAVLSGGDGADVIVGDNGSITRPGGTETNDGAMLRSVTLLDLSTIGGADVISGGNDDDQAFGGLGADTINGDGGDDHLEGNLDADSIDGGSEQDDIVGGSSPRALNGAATSTAADTGDTLLAGGTGADVIVGDNGSIERGATWAFTSADPGEPNMVGRAVRLLDLFSTGANVGGPDVIHGDDGHDQLFGQVGNDTVAGGNGADRIEGNNGSDTLDGGDGQDEMLGGTSSLALAPGTATSTVIDIGDAHVDGGPSADVMLGDNGDIGHVLASNGQWQASTGDESWLRPVTLLDRLTDGGGDTMDGGAGNDRIWGEVGNDAIGGGDDADYVEGNLGADTISGGLGSDDLIGGTSPVGLAGSTAVADATASADVGDSIYGQALDQTASSRDDDAIVGDNGVIDRCTTGGRDSCTWSTLDLGTDRSGVSFGVPYNRYVTLLGEANTATNHDGDDVLQGNGDDDVMWGVNGNDRMWGNAAQDRMYGGYGNDRMFGGTGDDGMVGDRGQLTVVPVAGTPAQQLIGTDGPPNITETIYVPHTLWYKTLLLDVPTGGNDDMFGGQGDDSMHGGAGNDYLQGDDGLHVRSAAAATGGSDRVFGDDGQDSISGGPGRDHLFGGVNEDDLDVVRGTEAAPKTPKGSMRYPTIATLAAAYPGDYDSDPGAAGDDIAYGGHSRDLLQADTLGDRLVDSYGNYNLFYVCPAAYGGAQITRALSPGVISFFQQLAEADGAIGAAKAVTDPSSTGAKEASIVYTGEANDDNAGSAYPNAPGHFTCT
jgi:Ca2+-binding RTX toxin-like protein